jgi:hypothetical protein
MNFGIHEIKQDLELIEAIETRIKQTVALFRRRLANMGVIELPRTIPA